jgi:comEA protein
VTREERNVLLFVALGVVVGSWPAGAPRREAEARPDATLETRAVDAAAEEVGRDSLPDAETSPRGERREAGAEAVDLFPIDLNEAPAEWIEELPGIGPAKARAIVELRERKGSFRTVDELTDVRGIGPKTVDRLRGLVTVGRTDGGDRERGRSHLGERATGVPAPRERGADAGAARAGAQAAEVQR